MTIITVSQLNNYIKRYIDNNELLNLVYIQGEISNFKRHTSGHIYLTLKDSGASIKCVMFSSDVASLKFEPQNGMNVIALGRISVYERDGVYQLYVKSIIPEGKGELYAAYEMLKSQLEKLGYFDEALKKTIPKYPSEIGIVTAQGGAALQDILTIVKRRYPIADVYVYPAQVQGVGAEFTIAAGIEYFNKASNVDVIICARGGGSIEDLWAFNKREVADAIYSSVIPVISAVGHETDFTISDFVADLRAATPSAAAEICVPDVKDLLYMLDSIKVRMKNAISSKYTSCQNYLNTLLSADLQKILENKLIDIELYNDQLSIRLNKSIEEKIKDKSNELSANMGKLDSLSPLSILSRGYSVVLKYDEAIKSTQQLTSGDRIDVVLSDGNVSAVVI